MIRRRDFITLLGGAAAAWPLVARAQQATGLRRIGSLSTNAAVEGDPTLGRLRAFKRGLADLGWIEGRNVVFEERWASNDPPIIAALINPNNATAAETQSKELQGAASALGLQLHILHASSEHDFDAAFATMIRLRVGGLVIGGDGFFVSRSQQLATLALRHGIPAVFQFREFAAAGGLMSYGGRDTGQFRQLGIYAGRILKGGKPGDLPVQQNSSIELMINMNTAKALGLTVPLALLTRADEVIE
jgi:hypothetical protein